MEVTRKYIKQIKIKLLEIVRDNVDIQEHESQQLLKWYENDINDIERVELEKSLMIELMEDKYINYRKINDFGIPQAKGGWYSINSKGMEYLDDLKYPWKPLIARHWFPTVVAVILVATFILSIIYDKS